MMCAPQYNLSLIQITDVNIFAKKCRLPAQFALRTTIRFNEMVDVLKIAVLMCVSRRNKVLKNVVYINPHLHVRFKGFLLLNCELFASLKKRRIPRRSLQIGVHRRALPSKMKQQARLYHNICLSYPVIFGLSEKLFKYQTNIYIKNM